MQTGESILEQTGDTLCFIEESVTSHESLRDTLITFAITDNAYAHNFLEKSIESVPHSSGFALLIPLAEMKRANNCAGEILSKYATRNFGEILRCQGLDFLPHNSHMEESHCHAMWAARR